MKLISSKPHLLESRVVQDVCRTSIVHQHLSGCIVSNEQSNDNRVVMWVMNPFSILVCERNGLFIHFPCLWGSSYKLDVLHYLQVCLPWLEDCPINVPPMMPLISQSGGRDDFSSFPFNFSSLWSRPRKFHNFPYLMRFFIWCFKSKHSSVSCLWSLWKRQYLFLSRLLGSPFIFSAISRKDHPWFA